MTTAIALETSKGDLPLCMGLGLVLLAVVLVLQLLIAGLRVWMGAAHPRRWQCVRPERSDMASVIHTNWTTCKWCWLPRGARTRRWTAYLCVLALVSAWPWSVRMAAASPRCCACCMACWYPGRAPHSGWRV